MCSPHPLCNPWLSFFLAEMLMPKSSGKGAGEGFDVNKSGDARVGLVGFPSVGKSTLLNKLTDTHSLAAAYGTSIVCVWVCGGKGGG